MAGTLSKDLVLRLIGDSKSAEAALLAAANSAEVSVGAYKRAQREADKQARAAAKAAKEQQESMTKLGQGAMVFGAVMAAGLALATYAAVQWETAWTGVTKVVDGSPEQMAALEAQLRQLATTLPASQKEIAGVAEAAGQLGIARDDIVKFTATAIALGVTTNLSAADAATGLARLSNIMGTSSSDVDRLGSALVALGNNGASTESEILTMGLRIAAAGRQAGMSEGDVLGFANAMSSLGIQAEAGGTAISTVFKKINTAVLDGGADLATYAQLAGMSAQQFAKAWRDDAAGAFVGVVRGLGQVQAAGGNTNTVLKDLRLNDIRVSDTMLRLSGNAQLLADSLTTGNQAWADNTALVNEAAKRYATTASKLQIALNAVTEAGITIGSVLLPVLAAGADLVADFARGFSALPGWMQDSITVIAAATAGISLLGGAAMFAAPKIVALRASMTELAASSGRATSMVGRFGSFMMGPWGAVIGVATLALGGLITWLGRASEATAAAAAYTDQLAGALRESNGAIDENVRALAAQKAADTKIGDSNMLAVAKQAGVQLPRLTDALLGNRDAYEQVSGALTRYIAAHSSTATDPSSGIVTTFLDKEGAAANGLMKNLRELSPALALAGEKNKNLATATAESGAAAAGAAGTAGGQAKALGGLGESADSATQALKDLSDALDNLNRPTLNLRDAQNAFQEAVDSATGALAANGRSLDVASKAGRANRKALDDVAEAGIRQAQAVLGATGSTDAFRIATESARQTLFEQAKQFFATQQQAWDYVDSVLAVPAEATTSVTVNDAQARTQLAAVYRSVKNIPPGKTVNVGVLSAAAMRQLRDLGFRVRNLPDGTVEVTADTRPAVDGLNGFLRRPAVKTVRIITDASGASIGADFSNRIRARADGGPVWPGEPFLVGEKGPELVRFGASGSVIPADQTARILAGMSQPTAPRPLLAAPGSSTRPGAAVVQIDYTRLAAALAAVADRRPTVGQIVVQKESTAREAVDYLAATARTGSS